MGKYTARNGTEEAVFWTSMSGCDPTPVLIRNCQFIGQPTTRHIVTAEKRVTIQDVTMFPGRLTPWGRSGGGFSHGYVWVRSGSGASRVPWSCGRGGGNDPRESQER